ncbi:hypothetical protein BD289DRAFT_484109 [Coniella lustricola]|uniref:Uncharacterized protein n=1 Tax=Coniella lustricola TaxID=2025994 RepID=A0A2T3A366_9PEZI|nr:hypothetical protein BD289DRAFT_484109 [Coniella lustricola]
MSATGPSSQAAPSAREPQDDKVVVPNVRPAGPEICPDPRWRKWRLREQRPELRDKFPPFHPAVAPLLAQQGQQEIDRYANAAKLETPTFRARSMHDLADFSPTRLQFRTLLEIEMDWVQKWNAVHPRTELRDQDIDKLPNYWFEEMAHSLAARILELAATAFGQADLADRVLERDWTEKILQHLPADFVRCASLVARGDPLRYPKLGPNGYNDRGYEMLFLSRDDRVYLCAAVIAKLLQEYCLDSLLFGATAAETQALSLLDESTIHVHDGFMRKFARYTTVHSYMMNPTLSLHTDKFWEQVDLVTADILNLLLPLINMMGSLTPDAPWPPITQVHQMLHNCVAEAAYLANGDTFTRSCSWISFPQPGQRSDQYQEHLDDKLWKLSKKAATAHDAANQESSPEMAEWYRVRDQRWQEAALEDVSLEDWSATHYEPLYPKPVSNFHRSARVQIVLFPFIQRYFPLGLNVTNGGLSNNGNEITLVQKAQVVYYAGQDADEWETYTLEQHLDAWKRLVRRRSLADSLPTSVSRFLARLPRTRDLILGIVWLLLFLSLFMPSKDDTSGQWPWKFGGSNTSTPDAGSTSWSSSPTIILSGSGPSSPSPSASSTSGGFWDSIKNMRGNRKDASADSTRQSSSQQARGDERTTVTAPHQEATERIGASKQSPVVIESPWENIVKQKDTPTKPDSSSQVPESESSKKDRLDTEARSLGQDSGRESTRTKAAGGSKQQPEKESGSSSVSSLATETPAYQRMAGVAKKWYASVTDRLPAASNTSPQHSAEESKTESGQSTVLDNTDKQLRHAHSGVTPEPSHTTTRRGDITLTNAAADPMSTVVLKDFTVEEYQEMIDKPLDKDSHWTVSDFFGLRYNCTFSEQNGLCFQAVTAPPVTSTTTTTIVTVTTTTA